MKSRLTLKRYCTALVCGNVVSVVEPSHFHAAESQFGGQGLHCDVDLLRGDIWWAHDFSDPRFVARIIPWEHYLTLSRAQRADAEKLCYVNPDLRALIICTEPFCRVNHGSGDAANCDSDQSLNSIISRHVPAGMELLIPYDYEAVVSVLWKFPELRNSFSLSELETESLLLSPAVDYPQVIDFLARFGNNHG